MKEQKFEFNPEKTFYTSDTHFCHANIIRLCNRPFKDVDYMNEKLIENWNKVVPEDGTVFHWEILPSVVVHYGIVLSLV